MRRAARCDADHAERSLTEEGAFDRAVCVGSRGSTTGDFVAPMASDRFMNKPLRWIPGMVLLVAMAPAMALVGRVSGTAGTTAGARFTVTGVASAVHQSPAAGSRFGVTAFPIQTIPEAPPDPLFGDGFE